MKQIEIYTDGACLGNPGPGGWSVHMPRVHAGHVRHEKLLASCALDSTNNRMELVAAIHGFEALTRSTVTAGTS